MVGTYTGDVRKMSVDSLRRAISFISNLTLKGASDLARLEELWAELAARPHAEQVAGARVFRERGRNWSGRWYALPYGFTYHSRATGHLEPSRWSVRELEAATQLEEITDARP